MTVTDSNGSELENGDSVQLIKDLKIKDSSNPPIEREHL
jgi:uncharacterized Zn ribbon protein